MILNLKRVVPSDNRTARLTLDLLAECHNNQTAQIAFLEREKASLQAKLEEATKTKKRQSIKKPSPTARFMSIEWIVGQGFTVEDLEEEKPPRKRACKAQIEPIQEAEDEPVVSGGEGEEDSEAADELELPAEIRTRAGRQTRPNSRYLD